MSLVRRIARPLLAAPFIFEGVQTAIRPDRVLDALPVTIADIDEQVSKSPLQTDAETILRAAGGLAAVAGAAFALNKKPRLASATLLLTTTVGLAGRKRVWELKGTERTEELRAIAGDLGLLGGILLAAVDTDGKPSLAYRVDKAIERAQKSAAEKQRELEKAAKKNKKKSSKSLDELDRTLAKKIKRAA